MELTESLKPTPKAPWSPMGIAVLTLLFSPAAGGLLHALNYGRLGQSGYRRFTLARNLLACVLLLLFGIALSSRPGSTMGASFFFAAYFYKTQERAFQRHILEGGKKGSIFLAILLSLVAVSLFFLLGILLPSPT